MTSDEAGLQADAEIYARVYATAYEAHVAHPVVAGTAEEVGYRANSLARIAARNAMQSFWAARREQGR